MKTLAALGALVAVAGSALTGCSAGTTSGGSAGSTGKAYDLGRGEIYKQAFWQFTGTGTPWQKACEAVVADRQAIDGSQPWWNHDEALKGCLGAGDGDPADKPAQPMECTPEDGNQIKVYNGDISCADAYTLAKRYDLQGQKFQEIDSADRWSCYTGVADTRPLIFTCVSGGGTEFGVYPAP